jgi:Radical SAM superfamily
LANCIILTGGTWNRDQWSKIQRSLGPYRIATSLEQAGYSTFILDYVINFTFDEIKEVLSKHIDKDTLWVGFSSTFFWIPEHGKQGNSDNFKMQDMYWAYDDSVRKLVEFVKSFGIKTIYGGTKTEFFLGQDTNIDYYVTGLADNSIVALTNYIRTNDSSYLIGAEKINESCIIDSSKYPEPQMDNIRTHWWNKHFNVLKGEGLPIELARGCIFKCKFCTYPLLGKKKGTYLRDPSEFRDDLIRNWETHGTTDYFITDDTFNDDVEKIEELHKICTSLPFKPRFVGFCRLDLINRWPHTADLLSEMGWVGVFFGIETLHPDSAKSIGKGLHPNKVKDRLYWLRERWNNKINIAAGLILGLPHDTVTYFEEMLEWCLREDNPIQHIHMFPLHLNDRSKDSKPGLYTSEFNLHPEIYGYEFPGKNNLMHWELPGQNLSYTFVDAIVKNYNVQRFPMNKVAGFEVVKYLNIGIDLQDIYDLTLDQLHNKYDIPALNIARINEYKQLVGLKVNTG